MTLKISRLQVSTLLSGCVTALLLSATSVAAAIDAHSAQVGVAVYASYTDGNYATREAARLQALLASDVHINPVMVNGVAYQRLQSAPLARDEASNLVNQAKAAGYSAWYVAGSSNTHPSAPGTAESAPAAKAAINSVPADTVVAAESADDWVKPQILLSQVNPKLKSMLPEGPLLGDLYPPRAPLPKD